MRQVIRVLKTPVTLIILLAMLGYGAMWGLEHATMDSPTRSGTACVLTDVGGKLTPPRVTVRIFNAGTVSKAASLTRLHLNHYSFRVTQIGNSERVVANTVIIGNSADAPEVRLLQGFFEGAAAEGDGRADHTVDVIIFDKTKRVEEPVTSIPVDGPVCLPPQAKATPSPSDTASPSASPTATKKKKG